MGCTRLSYTMRQDGFYRVQSELVSTASIQTDYSLPATNNCASFLINRLLNDREDGNQQAPFSPEFELDQHETTDEDDDDDNDITDYIDLYSKRDIQTSPSEL